MKVNRFMSAGVATMAAAAVSIYFLVDQEPPSPKMVVGDNGFAHVTPPADFYGPGTFNTVEELPDGSLVLHPTCAITEADARELSDRRVASPTIGQAFESSVEGRLNSALSGVLQQISVAVDGETQRTVQLELTEVTHVTMPDQSLLELESKFLGGACEQAIVHNLRAGAKVCQTASVLQADLVYRVDSSQALTAEQRAALQGQIEAELGIGGGNAQASEVLGDDLFIGVRLRSFETGCIKLAV